MVVAMKIGELRKLSDSELEKKYDELAPNTVDGLRFFREEIQRRQQGKLAKQMFGLTVAIVVLTAIMMAVAVLQAIALFII